MKKISMIIILALLGMVMFTVPAYLSFTANAVANNGNGNVNGSGDGSANNGIPSGTQGGDYYEGAKDAPVTIIEYSDFQCPYCARFYTDTLPQIRTDYIDTGKVKLIFRNFPLSFHANAQKAAEAVLAAGEQGKFWEMHDKLFENSNALSVDAEKQWARELGLNGQQFDAALDSGKYAAKVAAEAKQGQADGVSGTPAFLINGKLLVGAQPYEVFAQAIDAELTAANTVAI
jgi:protein-disulfide isomerase